MPTPIPPPDSHYISLAQFQEWKARYSQNTNTILAPAYQGKNILATSELFNVEAISALVAVPGCAAIRIYYGMDTDLTVHAMLVAADKNGMDILPPGGAAVSGTGANFSKNPGDPPIVEDGQRCPPFCP